MDLVRWLIIITCISFNHIFVWIIIVFIFFENSAHSAMEIQSELDSNYV